MVTKFNRNNRIERAHFKNDMFFIFFWTSTPSDRVANLDKS